MLASVLIIIFSFAMFVYWFRYSCLLLLRDGVAQAGTTEDNRFHFPQVQQSLQTATVLDPLHQSLKRDYEVLNYLINHAAGLELDSVEDKLLVLDYKVMQVWYRLTGPVSPNHARRALGEMASVLGVLTHRMSVQAAVRNQA